MTYQFTKENIINLFPKYEKIAKMFGEKRTQKAISDILFEKTTSHKFIKEKNLTKEIIESITEKCIILNRYVLKDDGEYYIELLEPTPEMKIEENLILSCILDLHPEMKDMNINPVYSCDAGIVLVDCEKFSLGCPVDAFILNDFGKIREYQISITDLCIKKCTKCLRKNLGDCSGCLEKERRYFHLSVLTSKTGLKLKKILDEAKIAS